MSYIIVIGIQMKSITFCTQLPIAIAKKRVINDWSVRYSFLQRIAIFIE